MAAGGGKGVAEQAKKAATQKAAADKKAASSYAHFESPTAAAGNDPFGAMAAQDAQFPDAGKKPIITGTVNNGPGVVVGSYGTTIHTSQTADELLRHLYGMENSEISALQTRLKAAGFTVDVSGVADAKTVTAYTTLVRNAQLYQTNGSTETPDQILDEMAKANAKSKARTQVSTQAEISLTNPVQARNTLLTAMADKLGRKPTDSEMAQFTQALNAYETANPKNTTTSTTLDSTGNLKNQDTTTTDKGTGTLNFTRDFADQYVQSQHAPEYQAAKNLDWYNVALSALTSSPGQ